MTITLDPYPSDLLEVQYEAIRAQDYDFATLRTAVTSALSDRDDAAAAVVTPAAELTAAQDAHVITMAAWVAAESPGSGAEFDAKEATAATLATKQGVYDGVAATLATDQATLDAGRAALSSARAAVASAAAKAVQTLVEHPGYKPATESQRVFDMFNVFALSIMSNGTSEEVLD